MYAITRAHNDNNNNHNNVIGGDKNMRAVIVSILFELSNKHNQQRGPIH